MSTTPNPGEAAYYASLIAKLTAVRKARGISQEALSDRIGASCSMVAKWEAGHRLPSSYSLMMWCQALGVVVDVSDV